MASWLPETLFEALEQGSAPSKDYYQLQVTRSQVIFRWWKISLRSEYRSSKPGEVKENHKDFLENSHLQVPGRWFRHVDNPGWAGGPTQHSDSIGSCEPCSSTGPWQPWTSAACNPEALAAVGLCNLAAAGQQVDL